MKLSYLFLFAIGLTVVAPTHSGSLEPPPGSISGTRGPDTCFSQNGGKFVDCGDGTVKDRTTGLYWLKDATCLGLLNWEDGNLAIAQLGHGQCGLTDGSLPGDWRLPTLACPSGISCALSEATGEFATIFNPSCPAPYIQNVVGIGCGSEGDPFTGALPVPSSARRCLSCWHCWPVAGHLSPSRRNP